MSATMDDATGLHGLIGFALSHGEPALPDVDSVLGEIEVLGRGIRRRQRAVAGVGAAALCLTVFGMVVGISALAHSGPTTSVTGPGSGGSTSEVDSYGPPPPIPLP